MQHGVLRKALLATAVACITACARPAPSSTVPSAPAPAPPTPASASSLAASGPTPSAPPPRVGSRSSAPAPPGRVLHDLRMVAADLGWAAVDGDLLRTADGGRTWVQVFAPRPPFVPATPAAVAVYGTADVWFAVGSPGTVHIYRTTDAGKTWEHAAVAVPSGLGALRYMQFADPDHGWLWVSDLMAAGTETGTLLATSDGGAHWTPVARAAPDGTGAITEGGGKTGFLFDTPTDGWVTDYADAIYTGWLYGTSDGGHTWARLPLTLPPRQVQWLAPVVHSGAAGAVLAVLDHTSGLSAVGYTTSDGGRTWKQGQSFTVAYPYLACSFPDAEHGFCTDGQRIFATADGAATWVSRSPAWALQSVPDLDFVTSTLGFALGGGSDPQGYPYSVLFQTTDGALTWTPVRRVNSTVTTTR